MAAPRARPCLGMLSCTASPQAHSRQQTAQGMEPSWWLSKRRGLNTDRQPPARHTLHMPVGQGTVPNSAATVPWGHCLWTPAAASPGYLSVGTGPPQHLHIPRTPSLTAEHCTAWLQKVLDSQSPQGLCAPSSRAVSEGQEIPYRLQPNSGHRLEEAGLARKPPLALLSSADTCPPGTGAQAHSLE